MGKDQDVLQAVKDRDIPLLQKLLIKGGKSGKTSKFINDSILILIKKIHQTTHCLYKKSRVVTL
jgi:hypothetical protein